MGKETTAAKTAQDNKNATAEVAVTETAAQASTATVPVAPATPAVPKTRLFWQKTCHDLKQSTNTEIKEGEVFTKTSHRVMVQPEGATEPQEAIVYSLKRGKRIYYTPYVTDEQRAAADAAFEAKEQERLAKEKEKADKKAAAEAEKAAKAATQPAAAQPAATTEETPA
jgi:hypothetical protein